MLDNRPCVYGCTRAMLSPARRRIVAQDLRFALWPPSVVLTLAAIVLAWVVAHTSSDRATTVLVVPHFSTNSALIALSAIATGMLAFTGLVSAVILLALQFGAGQFSPRLLRWLVGRSVAKWALGVSVAAFVYTLLVIGGISSAPSTSRVPSLAVEVSIILVFAAIGTSLYLLHATTQTLRVARIATLVARQGAHVIETMYPERADAEEPTQSGLPGGDPFIVRWTGGSGVVAGVENDALLTIAQRDGLVVQVIPGVGDGVEEGAELLRIWGPVGADPVALRNAVVVGDERMFDQDPMFALRILVDIAIRALSPAVNDPTTATQCLHRIEALLVLLSTRRLDVGVVRDDAGVPRLVLPSPTWNDFIDLGLAEIRRAGAGQYQTVRRLRALLDKLGTLCPPSRQAAIERHRLELDELVDATFMLPHDHAFARRPDAQGIGGL